jgi:anti-sigma B factor antagonist
MQSYLSVVVRDRPDATVMTVSGELDVASSPQLSEALDRLDLTEQRPMVLDLAGLEFIDVTGLRVLLRAQEKARQTGTQLTVVNVSQGIRRLLKLTGTTDLLEPRRR